MNVKALIFSKFFSFFLFFTISLLYPHFSIPFHHYAFLTHWICLSFLPFHSFPLSSNREIIMILALKKRGKNLSYMYVCVFHDMGRLRWGSELDKEAKLVKRRSANSHSDWHFGVREAWLWILFLQFTSCTTLFISLPYSSFSFFICKLEFLPPKVIVKIKF